MQEVSANQQADVIVIGAGAAGLFCAIEAGKRGRKVVVIDHAKRLGGKILMSGGGRCNFTNMYASHENFICENPHFCKSALSQYTQWDFIALVNEHGIAYHEKTLGQLFCDHSAKDIVDMLLAECKKANVVIKNRTEVSTVAEVTDTEGFRYAVETSQGTMLCESLVIATGGLSMPKLGATPYGYKVAEQFGLPIIPTKAALVPFTLHEQDKAVIGELSGISVDANAQCNKVNFNENILFTHRGLSGPAVLQISSYWEPGQAVEFNLFPNGDLLNDLQQQQQDSPDTQLSTALSKHYPKRFVTAALPYFDVANKPLKQYTPKELASAAEAFTQWQLKPNGTEGYRTAEVTLGGVNTDYISSKTMEVKQQKGLFFIGEVLDVTGWLGGYNFQWAWSSGYVAGQVV
ncbi:NAD(P)/FAD-dependent oxidoreductase [Glaciecola sp. MH2013]|uniref:NAD(P)/FAD-dependent oxidoreductase n=1 Tax=Glaciecola sp. MH2013 TaxID=2785524 RepID=UPI00189EE14F|nr:NAD(P)/FAD-dependent oxidoreductase [Glaciecola sp. MH2013]MBF7073534.1 NAD(P)/FAD-dependent oxidoreductase [Glaciecola sp. MH2013]